MKLQIGDVILENNIILAPMAGVTDLPFRLLCREMGAGMLCTEMVSAKAIMYNNRNTKELLTIHEKEHPVSLQLFGCDPDIISSQAARIEEVPFDLLDINMGCPVPKVVNNGEGSALMKNPELAAEIVRKTVKAISKPVTAKIRKGFDEANVNAVEMAKRLEDAGVAAIAVHGRTREQYYSGQADWDIIAQVKEAVSVPVIGNGDVVDGASAKKMLDHTGCDGIMVARAARGNPWIFREIEYYLENVDSDNRFSEAGPFENGNLDNRISGNELLYQPPTLEEKKEMILRHGKMLVEYKGEFTAIREMRKHVSWYTSGMPHSAKFRGRINEIENMDMLIKLVEDLV